jgi:predicted Holliday junction resolvase-like endonuclease
MELANAFYIIGIICMSLMTIIMIVLIAVVIAISAKINKIHKQVEAKFQPLKDFANTAEKFAKKAKDTFTK